MVDQSNTRREFLSTSLFAGFGCYASGIVKAESPPTASQTKKASRKVSGGSHKTSNDGPPAYLQPPATLGPKTAPGTEEQRQRYVHAYSSKLNNNKLTIYIRHARYKAVYGVYPDGSKTCLPVPGGLEIETIKELPGQCQMTKYLKWYRKVDPAAYAVWLISNPKYKAQS